MKQREIFIEALQKEPESERAAFLDAACGDDVDLRQTVEELLASHQNDASFFLDAPPPGIEATEPRPVSEKPGSQIGPYKLLQEIGQGGMGVVYMAEQSEPVKRRVALKLIKPGMDTREVIARFEAERQALALMDHPSIAKVLDAGATESGRPYFVMELVNGIPITTYCDQQQLTPRQRLELFVPICQAVQHAHQKGIIHRDLKPTNVLIALYDGEPVPKVIDFGVAKATSQDLTERTLFTQLGQIVGTLEYMSPEQAQRNQLDVDTRSDIYSLGVLLYELLTGVTPFGRERLRSVALEEMMRIIREEEPPKPSLRLSTSESLPSIAANRHTEPKKLSTLVRGELDWIVIKALEKDRTRRYETANGFANDIRRYLNDEPVNACPPSTAYRLTKFVRKNKVAIVTALSFVALLLIGLAGTTWQMVRATKAEQVSQQRYEAAQAARADAETARASEETLRQTAERRRVEAESQRQVAEAAEKRAQQQAENARTQAAIAKAVNAFLNDDLLAQAAPTEEADRDIKLRTVVDRASQQIDGKFPEQPLVEAQLRQTLGSTYHGLGAYQLAEKHFQRALDINRLQHGDEHLETLAAVNNLANAYEYQGHYDRAELLFEQALDAMRKIRGDDDARTIICLSNLAWSIQMQGRSQDAEPLFERVIADRQRTLGADHPDTLTSLNDLATVYYSQKRYLEAKPLFEKAVELLRRNPGVKHPDTLRCMHNLASVYKRLGNFEEAERLFVEVLETRREVLSDKHPDTLSTMHNLAWLYHAMDRNEIAEQLYIDVLAMRRTVLGDAHPETLSTLNNLAAMYFHLGRHADAEPLLRESLATLEQTQPDTWQRFRAMSLVGDTVLRQVEATADVHADLVRQQLAEAQRMLLTAYEGLEKCEEKAPSPQGTARLVEAAERIVSLYELWEKTDEKETWKSTLDRLRQPVEDPKTQRTKATP